MWGNVAFERGDTVIYQGRQFLVRRIEDGIATLMNDEGDYIRVAVEHITDVYFD